MGQCSKRRLLNMQRWIPAVSVYEWPQVPAHTSAPASPPAIASTLPRCHSVYLVNRQLKSREASLHTAPNTSSTLTLLPCSHPQHSHFVACSPSTFSNPVLTGLRVFVLICLFVTRLTSLVMAFMASIQAYLSFFKASIRGCCERNQCMCNYNVLSTFLTCTNSCLDAILKSIWTCSTQL